MEFRVQGLGFRIWGLGAVADSQLRLCSDPLTLLKPGALNPKVGMFPLKITVLNGDYNRGYENP